jgi:predicted dehydrogenase
MKRLRVIVLDPGHFHAALSLRECHPGLADDVHVYAPEGPGLAAFCTMIESFNRRAANPTRWRLHCHHATDPLAALLHERLGDLVILAGKNDTKLAAIERLNDAGLMIFADKPWVTSETAIPTLTRALGPDRPPTTDIMTSRFEPTSILLRAFLAESGIFGQPVTDSAEPALFLGSVHHLLKVVNDSVLRRPEWYFDVGTQGEGIIDVTTHLVDLAQWALFPGQKVDFSRDVRLDSARRWATPVTLESFRRITGADQFPDAVRASVRDDVLALFCNGEIRYRVKGVPVKVNVAWNLEQPPGAGDTHLTVARGTKADLIVRQLPEHGYRKEFVIAPRPGTSDLRGAITAALQRHVPDWGGVAVAPQGREWLVQVPPARQTTHEQHFCEARDAFLRQVDSGVEPAEHRANLAAKYQLLAAARTLALASPAGAPAAETVDHPPVPA